MEARYIYLSQLSPVNRIYAHHGGSRMNDALFCNDCFMALYIAHGSGSFETDGEALPADEGDVFLIAPDTAYRLVPVRGLLRMDYYQCLFMFDVLGGVKRQLREQFAELADLLDGALRCVRAADSPNREIRDVFIKMISEQLSPAPCGAEMLSAYLVILLTKLLRSIKARDFRRTYGENRTVDEALRYIHAHMYSKLSLDEVAAHLNVSPSFVCRLFREYVGMSTSQYINSLRVEKIMDILKNTDKSAKAVPEMFGCSPGYLKKVFKKNTGMTMSEYREKYNYKYHPADEPENNKGGTGHDNR